MIVYVIERGEYSDRYVHAVVEDEELAKKVVERLNEYYAKDYEFKDASYTAYDTNQFLNHLNDVVAYYVTFDEINFSAIALDCIDSYSCDVYKKYKDIDRTMYLGDDDKRYGYKEQYIVFARDKEHAIKIAQDMRMKRLAEEQGL